MGIVILAFSTTLGQTIRTFVPDDVGMSFYPLPFNVLLFHSMRHKFLYSLCHILICVCHPFTSCNKGRIFTVKANGDWTFLVACSSQEQGMTNCRDFRGVVRVSASTQEVHSVLL